MDALDQYMPTAAAEALRKIIRRARRLDPWIQSFAADFTQVHDVAVPGIKQDLQQLQTIVQQQAATIQTLKNRISALEAKLP